MVNFTATTITTPNSQTPLTGPPVRSQGKKNISVSTPLHSLVKYLSSQYGVSYEQLVSKAIVGLVRASPVGPSDVVWSLANTADNDIKARYLGVQSRRSAHMRRINDARRKAAASPFASVVPSMMY